MVKLFSNLSSKFYHRMVGHFRYTVWDPPLIIAQIISMISILYGGLGFCLLILDYIIGTPISLGQVFSYSEIHTKGWNGKIVLAAFTINSLCCSIGLWFIVQRTKQCLDFSVTIHLFHLIACCYYNGYFPITYSWWLLNAVCVTVMCVCGEFLCMKSELSSIPVTPRANL